MSQPKPPAIELFKIVLSGDSGVGKTCFLHRYIQGVYKEDYPTIGAQFYPKTVKLKDGFTQVKILLWDTAGRERFSNKGPIAYRGARGVIICFDLTDRQSFVSANQWRREASKNARSPVPTILVGTKADLADRRQVSTEEAKEFAQHAGMSYFETSAKDDIGVDEAMRVLVNEIAEAGPADLNDKESDPPAVPSRPCSIL